MTQSNPTPGNDAPQQKTSASDATASSQDQPIDQSEDLDLHALKAIVTEKDLPLHCPPTNAPLWKLHPRVYLEIAETGSVTCPYCGTYYELAPGVTIPVHPH